VAPTGRFRSHDCSMLDAEQETIWLLLQPSCPLVQPDSAQRRPTGLGPCLGRLPAGRYAHLVATGNPYRRCDEYSAAVAADPDGSPRNERHWNVGEISPRDRFAAWCEILSTTHLAFATDIARRLRDDFAADIREQTLGSMSLVDASVLPHRGRRTHRQVSANTRDVIGLHFIQSGKQAVDLGDERVILEPGDAMIWDGAATGEYEILEPLTKKTLIVPRTVAATVLPSYRSSFVKVLPKLHPPTGALVAVLSMLSEQLPTMNDGARAASAALVTELLKPLDSLGGRDEAAQSRPRLELRERALDYIDTQLGDPKLGPAMVAAAHGVSVRTLYNALDSLGVTLSAYIRTRRLARCHDDLLSSSDPVGVIARRWGFSSQAHFSRTFHHRYGVSPSRIRRR
jgi:AraC family transcriptional activator of tynA and feaB